MTNKNAKMEGKVEIEKGEEEENRGKERQHLPSKRKGKMDRKREIFF